MWIMGIVSKDALLLSVIILPRLVCSGVVAFLFSYVSKVFTTLNVLKVTSPGGAIVHVLC